MCHKTTSITSSQILLVLKLKNSLYLEYHGNGINSGKPEHPDQTLLRKVHYPNVYFREFNPGPFHPATMMQTPPRSPATYVSVERARKTVLKVT